ncbi:hypothetical protein C804_02379 [Lachnospiraceae bacterium A4]|nr:hypothetical protein C804_02379 [Lachnospiraceae bacterium A4]
MTSTQIGGIFFFSPFVHFFKFAPMGLIHLFEQFLRICFYYISKQIFEHNSLLYFNKNSFSCTYLNTTIANE